MTWTVTAAQLARTTHDRANRDDAVRAVFRLIGDDLRTFDAELRPSGGPTLRGARRTPRVRVEESALSIDTRAADAGTVTHRYALAPGNAPGTWTVERTEGASPPRLLVMGVSAFRSRFDEKFGTLHVTLELDGGVAVSRSYRVP